MPFGTPTLFTAGLVGNTVASATLTTDTLVPAGALIVILTYEDGTSSVAGNVTDSVNGSTGWIKANSSAANSNSTGWGAIHYIQLTAALPAGTVITYTCGTAARHGWLCGAWVTGATLAPLDLNPAPYSGALTSAVLASGTPSLPNEVLFAGFTGNAVAYAVTPAPGWNNLLTANATTNNPGIFFGYIQETTPAAQTCTVANAGGRAACMFILSFKPTTIQNLTLSVANTQSVQSIRRISKLPFPISNPESVLLSRRASRPLALTALKSPELLSYRRAVGKPLPLTSQELVTILKRSNVVKSITNPQLFSYIKRATRTVSLGTSELFSLVRRTNRTVSLSSSELVTVIKRLNIIRLITNSQLLSSVRRVTRIVLLGSPELFSFVRRTSKTVSLSSSELATVLKRSAKAVSIQNTQLFTSVGNRFKRVTLGFSTQEVVSLFLRLLAIRVIPLQSPQLVTISRRVSKTTSLQNTQLLISLRSTFKTVAFQSSELATLYRNITISKFSMVSGSRLALVRQVAFIERITNSQAFSHVKTYTRARVISLSSSELISQVQAISKTIFITSSGGLVTTAMKLTANIVRSITNPQKLLHSRAFAKTVTLLKSPELFSSVKRAGKTVLLNSTELLTKRLDVRKIMLLTFPELMTASRSVFRRVLLSSPQLFSAVRLKLPQRTFALASSQVLALARKSTKTLNIITPFQSLRVTRTFRNTINIYTASIVSFISSVSTATTYQQIVNLVSGQTVIATTKVAIGAITASFTNQQVFFPVRKSVSRIVTLRSIPSVIAIIKQVNHITLFMSPAILRSARQTSRSFTLFSPAAVSLNLVKTGRLIAAFSTQQVLSFRKTVSKIFANTLSTVLLVASTRQIVKSALIHSSSSLALIRSNVKAFRLYNPVSVDFKFLRNIPKLLAVVQGQYLKFITPNILIKLTQAQDFTYRLYVPGRVMAFMHQNQRLLLSKVVGRITNIKTFVAVALSYSRHSNQTAFALVSSSFMTLGRRIGSTVRLGSPSTLSVSWNAYRSKLISLLSHSALNVFKAIRSQFAIQVSTSQLVRIEKIASKLIGLSTGIRLVIVKSLSIDKVVGFFQSETLKATKTWYSMVSFVTNSTITVTTVRGFNATINLIQSSVFTVYTKVRTLIQKAIILLVGA